MQLSAETLRALFAMMQRAQGTQRRYVSVYHVPDADQEKEAGQRRMWSDPVKVKHWEEHLDTDTHIFFSGVQAFGMVGLRTDSVRGSARGLERTGHPLLDTALNFSNTGHIFRAWHGLSVAKNHSETPCAAASVAGSAL